MGRFKHSRGFALVAVKVKRSRLTTTDRWRITAIYEGPHPSGQRGIHRFVKHLGPGKNGACYPKHVAIEIARKFATRRRFKGRVRVIDRRR